MATTSAAELAKAIAKKKAKAAERDKKAYKSNKQ